MLYQKSASGAGAEERLADIPDVNLQDVSPDGRFVVYMILGKLGSIRTLGAAAVWRSPTVSVPADGIQQRPGASLA